MTGPLEAPRPAGSSVRRWSFVAIAALLVGSWMYLASAADLRVLFDSRTWARGVDFARALLGSDTPLSPGGESRTYLSATAWARIARLAYETLTMSILAVWFAAGGMLLTVMAGARPSQGVAPGRVRMASFATVRAAWIVARAVPELVWALMLVIVMPPGLLAGALALGIHNFGILGKLCSEVVEDLDPLPMRALQAAGASRPHTLLYGVLPQALPLFLTYALYRWEVIIRTTIVVGFVAAGGLGREFRLAMSFFHYTDLAMILLAYFALVLAVDAIAARLRGLAR